MKTNWQLFAIWFTTLILLAIAIRYVRNQQREEQVDTFSNHSGISSENLQK